MKLSAEQQRAVERTGQDVCVVAGPGSGKTRVLIERFAWLVQHRGIDPTRILAITFTEKAAIEIKQRLVKRFIDAPEVRENVERAWVSTIHGFCARLLRENAIVAGLAPDFAVLEQSSAERMAREAAEEALDALFAERPGEMRRLMEAIDLSTSDDGRQDDLAASLLRVYDAMRVSGSRDIPAPATVDDCFAETQALARGLAGTAVGGKDGPRLREWAAGFSRLGSTLTRDHFSSLAAFNFNMNHVGRNAVAGRLKKELLPQLESQWLGEWYGDLRGLLRMALERVDAAYNARKRREESVDFSDLEEYAVRLLESDAEVRRTTVARFDEVLMDELQDTNPLQWRLVELVKSRLFAVGDVNQSIYGFRHADPTVFTDYRETVGEVDELQDNYRSRREILNVVSQMLDGQDGIEPRELKARGTFTETQGPIVERLCAAGDDASSVEAAMVAARIQQGGFRYGEIAILVRTLAAAEPFEAAFDRAGIPFLVSGGRGFLEARETRDVMGFLAALVNVQDEIPLLGVLRGPLMGLSDAEIYSLGREGWRRVFEERFGALRQLAGFVAPDLLIARAFDECDYWGTLTERARANVDKLLGWLRREFRNRPRPLAEMLEDLEALREAQTISDAPPPEAGDVVRVMTIHAAKGLEFPVVFVSALQKGPDRRTAPLLFSRDLGLGAKWRNPVSGNGASDAVHAQLKERENAREHAEASRLLYVALTRAEQRLILTHAERKHKSPWEKLAIAALPDAETMAEAPAIARGETHRTEDAEQLLARPVIEGQYDSSATITAIALFEACPRRYYLSRYLGLEPEPDGPGTGAIATGLAVHALLAGQQVDSEEAKKLAAKFEASEWGLRAAWAQRVEREFDFLFEIDDVILRGQVDLWFEEAGELVIVDYKTDPEETSAESYALQLRLYALGLERYAGRVPDRAVLFYNRLDRAVEIGLSGEELEEARKRVGVFREAQERTEFPLRPGSQCKKCSFFGGLCPQGREPGTNSGRIFGPPSSFLTPASSGS